MIAKLERKQSNVYQTKINTKVPQTKGVHKTTNNNNRTTALNRTAAQATCGLNAFYWRQIFALDCVVVKTQNLLSVHGGFLPNSMHHNRETLLSN